MSERIITDLTEGVLTIVLNRPEKYNCIGWEMLKGLDQALAEAESNHDIRVVILKGAGDKSFSTGGDLNVFKSLSPAEARDWIMTGNQVFNRLYVLPKPTIAVIQGYALGGGLELALACDFRIATENAMFSFPEVAHGWLPGWGGMARLKRLAGEAVAKKMILLGEKISPKSAYEAGLITRLVSATELDQTVNDMTLQLKGLNSVVYEMAKAALHDPNRTTTGTDLLFDVLALRAED